MYQLQISANGTTGTSLSDNIFQTNVSVVTASPVSVAFSFSGTTLVYPDSVLSIANNTLEFNLWVERTVTSVTITHWKVNNVVLQGGALLNYSNNPSIHNITFVDSSSSSTIPTLLLSSCTLQATQYSAGSTVHVHQNSLLVSGTFLGTPTLTLATTIYLFSTEISDQAAGLGATIIISDNYLQDGLFIENSTSTSGKWDVSGVILSLPQTINNLTLTLSNNSCIYGAGGTMAVVGNGAPSSSSESQSPSLPCGVSTTRSFLQLTTGSSSSSSGISLYNCKVYVGNNTLQLVGLGMGATLMFIKCDEYTTLLGWGDTTAAAELIIIDNVFQTVETQFCVPSLFRNQRFAAFDILRLMEWVHMRIERNTFEVQRSDPTANISDYSVFIQDNLNIQHNSTLLIQYNRVLVNCTTTFSCLYRVFFMTSEDENTVYGSVAFSGNEVTVLGSMDTILLLTTSFAIFIRVITVRIIGEGSYRVEDNVLSFNVSLRLLEKRVFATLFDSTNDMVSVQEYAQMSFTNNSVSLDVVALEVPSLGGEVQAVLFLTRDLRLSGGIPSSPSSSSSPPQQQPTLSFESNHVRLNAVHINTVRNGLIVWDDVTEFSITNGTMKVLDNSIHLVAINITRSVVSHTLLTIAPSVMVTNNGLLKMTRNSQYILRLGDVVETTDAATTTTTTVSHLTINSAVVDDTSSFVYTLNTQNITMIEMSAPSATTSAPPSAPPSAPTTPPALQFPALSIVGVYILSLTTNSTTSIFVDSNSFNTALDIKNMGYTDLILGGIVINTCTVYLPSPPSSSFSPSSSTPTKSPIAVIIIRNNTVGVAGVPSFAILVPILLTIVAVPNQEGGGGFQSPIVANVSDNILEMSSGLLVTGTVTRGASSVFMPVCTISVCPATVASAFELDVVAGVRVMMSAQTGSGTLRSVVSGNSFQWSEYRYSQFINATQLATVSIKLVSSVSLVRFDVDAQRSSLSVIITPGGGRWWNASVPTEQLFKVLDIYFEGSMDVSISPSTITMCDSNFMGGSCSRESGLRSVGELPPQHFCYRTDIVSPSVLESHMCLDTASTTLTHHTNTSAIHPTRSLTLLPPTTTTTTTTTNIPPPPPSCNASNTIGACTSLIPPRLPTTTTNTSTVHDDDVKIATHREWLLRGCSSSSSAVGAPKEEGPSVHVPFTSWSSGEVNALSFIIPFNVSNTIPLKEMVNINSTTPSSTVYVLSPRPRAGASGDSVRVELYSLLKIIPPASANYALGEWVATFHVTYTGPRVLSEVQASVTLPTAVLLGNTGCSVNVTSSSSSSSYMGTFLVLHITLQAAPEPAQGIQTTTDVIAGVSVVGAVFSGVPSGLIQAGMINSLQKMLRCAEFDPEDEVEVLSNPPSWGVGIPALQYQRGSLWISVILIGVAGVVVLCGMLGLRMQNQHQQHDGDASTDGTPDTATPSTSTTSPWGDIVGQLRVPSVLLVIVLVCCEIAMATGASILFVGGGIASGGDYVLALVVIVPLWGYLIYYSYMCTIGCQIQVVECTQEETRTPKNNDKNNNDPESGSESDPDDDDGGGGTGRRPQRNTITNRPRVSKFTAFMQYILNPTHEPSIQEDHPTPHNRHRNNKDNADTSDGDNDVPLLSAEEQEESNNRRVTAVRKAEHWLQHNYYFVADRRWVQYGAAEAIVGSFVDLLEGIPVTSSSRVVCMARPIIMALLLTVLVVLLVWKRPYSVRLQQWSSVTVNVLLLTANITVVVNVMVAHSDIEAVASALLLVASLVIGVFSIIDSAMWILTFAPSLRRLFGLQPRLLRTVLSHLRAKLPQKKKDDDDGSQQQQKQDPVLVVEDTDDDMIVDDDLADVGGRPVSAATDTTTPVPIPQSPSTPPTIAALPAPASKPTIHRQRPPPPSFPKPPFPSPPFVDLSGKWGMKRGLATTGWSEEELRPKAKGGTLQPLSPLPPLAVYEEVAPPLPSNTKGRTTGGGDETTSIISTSDDEDDLSYVARMIRESSE